MNLHRVIYIFTRYAFSNGRILVLGEEKYELFEERRVDREHWSGRR